MPAHNFLYITKVKPQPYLLFFLLSLIFLQLFHFLFVRVLLASLPHEATLKQSKNLTNSKADGRSQEFLFKNV